MYVCVVYTEMVEVLVAAKRKRMDEGSGKGKRLTTVDEFVTFIRKKLSRLMMDDYHISLDPKRHTSSSSSSKHVVCS